MSLLIFFIILVALILVHELGHFAVAKLFNIRVDEFGIFFPPRLWARKVGETEYSINALPFGGFVRIFGEDGDKGSRSMAGRPRSVQAAVIVAGVVMNVLFAWAVLSLGYLVGLPTPQEHAGVGEVRDPKPLVVAVRPGSPADRVGLRAGDEVKALHTGSASLVEPTNAQEVIDFIGAHEEESVVIQVWREGGQKTVLAEPEEGVVPGRKVIGVDLATMGVLQLPPHLALVQGAVVAERLVVETARGLGQFFSRLVFGQADFSGIAGPIGIASIGAQAVDTGFAAVVAITALISVNLAIINLLPIPGLDGGRLLIIAVEAVMRRPVPRRLTLGLTLAGFALIIGLMVWVSVYDIARLVG